MSEFETQTYRMGPLSALRLDVSPESSIFRDMIYCYDRRALDEHNYVVNMAIPSILMKDFVVSPTLVRRVKGIEVHFPSSCEKVDDKTSRRLMTPNIAKLTKQNYMSRIVCNIENYNPQQNMVISTEDRTIGAIPCMVGSNRCVTAYKPEEIPTLAEWKMMCGEDPSIPGGYFIKEGMKKVMLHGEKLGTNTTISVETKGDNPLVETRITEMSNSKTTVLRLNSGKKRPTVKVLPPHLKGFHYPIFLVIYLLVNPIINSKKGLSFNCDTYIRIIARYAPTSQQHYIETYLQTSKDKFYKEFTTNEDGKIRVIPKLVSKYIIGKIKYDTDKSLFTPEGVSELLKSEISPSKTTVCEKVANLCLMACQHVRCCLKLRDFDSRDWCGLKRYDTGGRYIEQYIADVLIERLTNNSSNDESWGIGKKDKKENIVESMKADTLTLIRSLYAKINANVDSKSKSFALRAVSQSGYGSICPAKTSEGEKCGINKEKCVCTRVSYNSEHIKDRLKPIFDLVNIEDYSSCTHSVSACKYAFKVRCGKELIPVQAFKDRVKGDSKDDAKGVTVKKNVYVSMKFIQAVRSFDPNLVTEETQHDFIVVSPMFEEQRIRMWNGYVMDVPVSDKIRKSLAYGFSILNDYISFSPSKQYSFLFTYNGNVLMYEKENILQESIKPSRIWVHPERTVKYIKEKRRLGKLPIDCCAYRNNVDMTIQYHDDSGRLMTPYMIVDDDGDLVLDTLDDGNFINNNWKSDQITDYSGSEARVKMLFERGVMEYIDAKEIETTLIAADVYECRRFSKLRYFLNSVKLDDCDSYIYPIKGKKTFQNEDTTYVTLNKKKYDVEFTAEAPEDTEDVLKIQGRFYEYTPYDSEEGFVRGERVLVDDREADKHHPGEITAVYSNGTYDVHYVDGNSFLKIKGERIRHLNRVETKVVLYGQVVFKCKRYTHTNKRVVTLKLPKQCHIRDGLHLCYVEDDGVQWVPKGSVGLSDTTYKGHQILHVKFFKGETEITRILRKVKSGMYVLEKNPHLYLQNTGKNWFRKDEDGKIHWGDSHYHNGFTYNEVDFAGKLDGYFQDEIHEIYSPLTQDMAYETFNLEEEKVYFDKLQASNVSNDRECDKLLSYIRRYQKVIDAIDDFSDVSEVFSVLRKGFSSFHKRSNIYKITRYLNWRFKFTHAPIDPNIAYSATANLAMKANCNQGPRFTYQCAMSTQALGLGSVMYYTTTETSIKRMLAPQQHLVETVAEEPLNAVTMPTRVNFMLAVVTHRRGFEDALVMSKSLFESLRYQRDITITIVEKNENKVSERVAFPRDHLGNRRSVESRDGVHATRYSNLGDDGLPRLGSVINVGDCICGMMRMDLETGQEKDISVLAQIGEDGEVVQVKITSTGKERVIRIVLAQRRFYNPGDKLAAPHSQKGTIADYIGSGDTRGEGLKVISPIMDEEIIEALNSGDIKYKVIDDQDMPRIRGGPNDGMSIDSLFNPFSFPSRMTMGMNYGIVGGKACLRMQKKLDGTNFHDMEYELIEKVLMDSGLDKHGCEFLSHSDGEIMIDHTTGKPFKAFIGPCSYQMLKHHVFDKRSFREKGRRDPVARQPLGGRQFRGGQRMGEMEKDALTSHGGSQLTIERLMVASDYYECVFCTYCGNRMSEVNITEGKCKRCDKQRDLKIMETSMVHPVFGAMLNGVGLNLVLLNKQGESSTR